MTDGACEPARPSRTEVSALYDRGVDTYVELWSPVILPAARAVVATMPIPADATVVDVGGGSGAVIPAIRAAAPQGRVISVDPSLEMLRVAQGRSQALAVQADGLTLPLPADSADAVLLAFVLFHMADPPGAMTEAARVLRPGGPVGTATWAASVDVLPRAYETWDRTLSEAGAPPVSGSRLDDGLDTPEAMEGLLVGGGFTPVRVWIEHLRRQWSAASYFALATGSGMNRTRLDVLDPPTLAATLELARTRINALDVSDLEWSGDVVCAVAVKA